MSLIVIVIIMATFEILGIASIVPFMMLVSQPDIVDQNRWLRWAFEQSPFEDTRTFLIAMGAVVLSLLAARNITAVLARWQQYRFAWDSAHSIGVRLLNSYVYRPYEFFLQNNSSNLGKQVLTEVNLFARFILLPSAEIVSQATVSAVILILLIVIDPQLAITVFVVLGGVYAAIYAGTRKYMSAIGHDRFAADHLRFKSANELLSGIKSVKIRGCEEFFIGRFERASNHYTIVQPRYDIISQVPRHFVELLAFGGILLIILFLLSDADGLNEMIPLLSLYALAGLRLLPALQNLFKAVSAIRFHAPAAQSIYHDLQEAAADDSSTRKDEPLRTSAEIEWIRLDDLNGNDTSNEGRQRRPLTFTRRIEVRNLTYRFKGSEDRVLKGVSLEIPKHAHVAIVGPTGSGKTTLIDLLTGLLRPHAGRILIDGVELTEHNVTEWRRMLGYVPQDVVLYDDTLARNIAYGVLDEQVDMDRVRKVAAIACVDHVIADQSEGYDTIVGERGVRLSGGQRQRIGLARALYHEPEVLVLDEATNALDGITEEAVLHALANMERRTTIVTIAHRLATVRDHDRIYLLESGRVVAEGTYADLISTNDTFREMAKLTA